MRQEPSSISAFFRHFVRTCTGQPTAANPGQSCKPDGLAGGGDKQWFTIDKTDGPGHGFQYQSSDGINCSGGGVQFQRSTDGGVTWQAPITIPNEPTDGTLDVDTNGNLFIGGEGIQAFYCVRSSNAQIGGQTPTFDQVTQSTWVVTWLAGRSIRQDWRQCCSWRLIVPAARLTITFTCWPAWCRPDEARPTSCLCAAPTMD